MSDAFSLAVDLALFVLTVVVVGKRPTTVKVGAMICLVAAIEYGFVVLAAVQAHVNPIEWYQETLAQAMEVFGFAPQTNSTAYQEVLGTVVGISPAIYVVQATAYVFTGLCIRWVVDRFRARSDWSPFSEVDLSIWWLLPLLAGLCCYIVSLFLMGQASQAMWLISLNLFVVSVIPFFVQGAAALKGIANRLGFGLAIQVLLGALGLASSALFFVAPLVGLIDFWANFRKLPRDHSGSGIAKAE